MKILKIGQQITVKQWDKTVTKGEILTFGNEAKKVVIDYRQQDGALRWCYKSQIIG